MARPPNTEFWGGKCAIITGASRGIGRGLAECLGASGARVGLIARNAARLKEATRGIVESGGRAAWAAANVAGRDQMQQAVDRLQEQLGPCDVLIANAGIYRMTCGADFDSDVAVEVVSTNVNGAINTIGAVLPDMVDRGRGHIVAVSSIAGFLGLPAAGAYCASKAALIVLLRSLRLDLQATGVKVTVVCPGLVDTPLITDTERAEARGVVSVQDAARRICLAIEHGKSEVGFPMHTWMLAKLLGSAPNCVRRLFERFLPRMEDAELHQRS